MSFNLVNAFNEFINPNDNIWFGNGDFKIKTEENVLRSSLFQPTLGAKILKGWLYMTLEINLSLGQRGVKKNLVKHQTISIFFY